MSRPIKNREQFFKHVEEGLQRYFSECDRHWGGILHLTVGVKCGKVGGIIKSDDPFPFAPKEYIGDRLYYEKRVRRREGNKKK